jgi:hypothetical protein
LNLGKLPTVPGPSWTQRSRSKPTLELLTSRGLSPLHRRGTEPLRLRLKERRQRLRQRHLLLCSACDRISNPNPSIVSLEEILLSAFDRHINCQPLPPIKQCAALHHPPIKTALSGHWSRPLRPAFLLWLPAAWSLCRAVTRPIMAATHSLPHPLPREPN